MVVNNIGCPFCGNPVSIDSGTAGADFECPLCHRRFDLSAAGAIPRPDSPLPGNDIAYPVEKPVRSAQYSDFDRACLEPATPFTALKKYGVLKTRASRREFWFFYMFIVTAAYILQLIIDSLFPTGMTATILKVIIMLFFTPPVFCVTIRRLHDLDMSGWWICLMLIPFLGKFIIMVLMSMPSKLPDNKYGMNPNGFHPDKAAPAVWGVLFTIFISYLIAVQSVK